MSVAQRAVLGLDGEEVLERSVLVELVAQVGEVVAELHRLSVQLAVSPAAQHRHLGSGDRVAVASVARILEVVEGLLCLRLGGIEVGRDACAEEQLGTARIVHLHLDGTQRTVVLAHVVHFGIPPAVAHRPVGVEPGTAVGVRAVDEAAVTPPRTPGVDNDPGSLLVGRGFAIHAVAVEVKLDAVVIAHDGQRVVDRGAPLFDIVLARCTSFVVGGSLGNALPVAAAGHADACQTAGMERVVAVVVPQPVLHSLTSFFCLYAEREVCRSRHAVVHGRMPFLIAGHPAEVAVHLFLVAEVFRVGLSAVYGGRRHTHMQHKVLLARVTVGEQPHEVGGIIVVRVLAVEPAVGVELMREHVADA